MLLAAALGGCDQQGRLICNPVPDISSFAVLVAPESAGAAKSRAADCIHYEAYRIATESVAASYIAEGAMGACLAQIDAAVASSWLSLADLKDDPELQGRGWVKYAEIREYRLRSDLRQIALLRAVEAQAGRCRRRG
jgi:hypothetical protein